MIAVRNAKLSDMLAVSRVHVKCFPNYFSTKMGTKILKRYYTCYYKENPFFVVAESNGMIVGFCMGYQVGSRSRERFLKENVVLLGLQCLKLMFMLDGEIYNKLATFMHSKLHKSSICKDNVLETVPQGDLLSICMLDGYHGSGVASQMLVAFEKLLHEKGIMTYHLSVRPDNKRARAFYEKMGMRCIDQTDDSVVYEKKIQPLSIA